MQLVQVIWHKRGCLYYERTPDTLEQRATLLDFVCSMTPTMLQESAEAF